MAVSVVSSLAALLLAFIPASQSAGSCGSPDADVVIVGAGMAGISTANTLHEQGMKSFVILEARGEIGGRMRAVEIAGVKVEAGANWIHNVDRTGRQMPANPLWPLRQRCGLRGVYTDFSSRIVYNLNGMDVTESLQQRGEDISAAYERIGALSSTMMSANQPDISVRTALNRNNWNPTTAVDNFLDWFNFDFDFADPPDIASLYQTQTDRGEDFGSDEFFVTDQRGYAYLTNCLAEDFLTQDSSRLRLNTTVTAMEYNDSCVCAVTESSTKVCGRYGVATFSIGVLLNGSSVTFDPPLSQTKLNAIRQYTSGHYLKIFVQFNVSFWDNREFIGRLSNTRGRYVMFQPLKNFLPNNPNVVLVTVTGDIARRVSTQSSVVTKQEIMGAIQSIYPNARAEIVDMFVPDWYTNPLYYGSYSLPLVGATDQSRADIAAPAGRLYFTGEVVSRDYSMTVHGAYLAGIDTAMTIIRGSAMTTSSSVILIVCLLILSVLIHS